MLNKEKELAAVLAARKAIDDKFGKEIKVLDISGVSVLADYFIIATVGNPNQTRAVCEVAEEALHKHGVRLLHSEGMGDSGGWVLLDFGSIVIHLFDKEVRSFYNLERIWGDAAEISAAAEVTVS